MKVLICVLKLLLLGVSWYEYMKGQQPLGLDALWTHDSAKQILD